MAYDWTRNGFSTVVVVRPLLCDAEMIMYIFFVVRSSFILLFVCICNNRCRSMLAIVIYFCCHMLDKMPDDKIAEHFCCQRVSALCFTTPLLFSQCRMFRVRALSAVSVGLAQLSRRYHSGAVRGSGQRRLMLAALAGVTGVSASAGLLWKR